MSRGYKIVFKMFEELDMQAQSCKLQKAMFMLMSQMTLMQGQIGT